MGNLTLTPIAGSYPKLGLHKEPGVWYTPTEVMQAMVARVDNTLKQDLHIFVSTHGSGVLPVRRAHYLLSTAK